MIESVWNPAHRHLPFNLIDLRPEDCPYLYPDFMPALYAGSLGAHYRDEKELGGYDKNRRKSGGLYHEGN